MSIVDHGGMGKQLWQSKGAQERVYKSLTIDNVNGYIWFHFEALKQVHLVNQLSII